MKVCYLGDNRVRSNFGCRATSMALYDIIAQYYEIDTTIYGDITDSYRPDLYKGWQPQSRWKSYFKKFYSKLFSQKDEADFIENSVADSLDAFLRVYRKYWPLQEFYNKINNTDALILNGEGTFILERIQDMI